MAPRPFVVQLVVLIVVLATLNVAVARLSSRTIARRTMAAIDSSAPVTDLFTGNSLGMAGFDVATYDRVRGGSGVRSLNIALGLTWPPEHDLLLHRALRLRPARVFYGTFDLQLTDAAPNGVKDLIGNRMVAYLVDPAAAAGLLAPDDPLARWRIRAFARVPMLAEASIPWAGVEYLRRWLGSVGVAAEPTTVFGRATDARQLEPQQEEQFARMCADLVARRVQLTVAVRDMLEISRAAGSQFVVVEMPMPSEHRLRFYGHEAWRDYREYVASMVRAAGGRYLIASDWASDGEFADALHLSPAGAAAFTTRLAAAMR